MLLKIKSIFNQTQNLLKDLSKIKIVPGLKLWRRTNEELSLGLGALKLKMTSTSNNLSLNTRLCSDRLCAQTLQTKLLLPLTTNFLKLTHCQWWLREWDPKGERRVAQDAKRGKKGQKPNSETHKETQ